MVPANVDTPSLNIGSANSVPANAQNGDVWISNVASPKLAYRFGSVNYYTVVANAFNTFTGGVAVQGTTASNPQLAITQGGSAPALRVTSTGTGHALVVEDATTPDTSSTVIDQNGNVGIGVDPATWTAVNKLEVNGAITSTTASAKTNSTVVATTAFVKTSVVPTIVTVSTSPYNITTSLNWNTIVRVTTSSANSVVIPNDSTYNLDIGSQIVFIQNNTNGQITFNPATGVTLLSAGSRYKTNGLNSVCTLIKTAANEWILGGDLTT